MTNFKSRNDCAALKLLIIPHVPYESSSCARFVQISILLNMYLLFYFVFSFQSCLMIVLLPVWSCLPATAIALIGFTCVSLPCVFKLCPSSICAIFSLLPLYASPVLFLIFLASFVWPVYLFILNLLDFCLFPVSLLCVSLRTAASGIKELVLQTVLLYIFLLYLGPWVLAIIENLQDQRICPTQKTPCYTQWTCST